MTCENPATVHGLLILTLQFHLSFAGYHLALSPHSVKDAIGHVLTFGNINQYSPVVPDELQTETSNIDYWLEFCGSGGIENCEALIPFYEAANLFRQERIIY